MHIETNERALQTDDRVPARLRNVDLMQYHELLVSRRKLERVQNQPGQLHDRDSDELFVLSAPSDASSAQRV